MSLIVSIVFSLTSLFAIEGTFTVSGDYQVIQQKNIEVVFHTKTDEVEALKKQNYTCGKRGRFYKCVQFAKKPMLPEGVEARPKRQLFEFGKIAGKDIVAEGDDLLQYDVEQMIKVDGKLYKKARYTETSRIKKIQIGLEDSDESVYVIVTGDSISELQFYNKTKSRFSWTESMVQFLYPEAE